MSLLTSTEALSLSALSIACFAVIANTFQGDGEPLIASLAFSGIAFASTYSMIRWLSPVFMQAGLKGRDMSKLKKAEIPESLGADIVAATSGGGNKDLSIEEDHQIIGRSLHRFPHSKSVVILGIGDDLFDIRWRHKFFIPAFASIPVLIVYFVDYGVTNVVVPMQLEPYLGQMVDLGWLYYAYMAAIAIFCPNSINILAGINGIEVSQSIVIGCLLLFNDLLSLYAAPSTPNPHPATDPHYFSIYLILPFLGVSFALWHHNCAAALSHRTLPTPPVATLQLEDRFTRTVHNALATASPTIPVICAQSTGRPPSTPD
ncbi:zinc finger protein klf1 [Physcia stellaris]|nr:zinc finger protein klf1 [Physcia stellaris]